MCILSKALLLSINIELLDLCGWISGAVWSPYKESCSPACGSWCQSGTRERPGKSYGHPRFEILPLYSLSWPSDFCQQLSCLQYSCINIILLSYVQAHDSWGPKPRASLRPRDANIPVVAAPGPKSHSETLNERSAVVSARKPKVPSLPDIDAADRNNPLAATEFVHDIFAYYKRCEPKVRVASDYMSRQVGFFLSSSCINQLVFIAYRQYLSVLPTYSLMRCLLLYLSFYAVWYQWKDACYSHWLACRRPPQV